jgi:hypothetical protein
MDIRATLIGPDYAINPDLVMIPFEKVQFPTPGILLSTREIVIVFGENLDVGLSLGHCRNLQLQGMAGKLESALSCRFEDGQYRVKGSFGEKFGDYSIIPLSDGSFRMSGEMGHKNFSMRVFSTPALCTMSGTFMGTPVEYKLDCVSESSFIVKGKEGEQETDVRIFYTGEGIKIKGNHGKVFVEYAIVSTGEKIEMKGITKDKFCNHSYSLESETEIHVTGKPFQVPVDYTMTLYENGVAFAGNTGFYRAEYGFVSEEEEAPAAS